VHGEIGQNWAEMLQRLLALKSKNPDDNVINPTIGWAYGGLAESEYISGRFDLAFAHSRMGLSYDRKETRALRVQDRISVIVKGIIDKAESAYRNHRFDESRRYLEQALTIDPDNRRARKDWRILAETLKMAGTRNNLKR